MAKRAQGKHAAKKGDQKKRSGKKNKQKKVAFNTENAESGIEESQEDAASAAANDVRDKADEDVIEKSESSDENIEETYDEEQEAAEDIDEYSDDEDEALETEDEEAFDNDEDIDFDDDEDEIADDDSDIDAEEDNDENEAEAPTRAKHAAHAKKPGAADTTGVSRTDGAYLSPASTAEIPVIKPNMASSTSSKAAHSRAKGFTPYSGEVAVSDSPIGMTPINVKHTRKGMKILAIAAGILVIALGIAYLVGVFYFSGHYFPNTTIAGIDFSMNTPDDMKQVLDDRIDDYSFSIVGKGLNFDVTADQAKITTDSSKAAKAVLRSNNPWAWPVEVFFDHDSTSVLANAVSADGLASIINTEVAKVNETARAPKDAYVAYDEKTHAFEVLPEEQGTILIPEEVLAEAIAGVLNLQERVVVLDDALAQPALFANDKRLVSAAAEANSLTKANLELLMDGNKAGEVNSDISSKWVTITPDYKAKFNDDELKKWAEELADSLNTVGSKRTYTRPDGKEITVSGGAYGWEIDEDALVEEVVKEVKAGTKGVLDIPVLRSGNGYTPGGQDWGTRYVDVDLSEQYARFYDNDGSIIWESNIISGNPNTGHATPRGVWYVTNMASPSTLIGQMQSDGTPEYETTVKYWMPFEGNMVGFHDATWQSSFGGSRFLSVGSHGCINLSYNSAQSLYEVLDVGDVVVVHG